MFCSQSRNWKDRTLGLQSILPWVRGLHFIQFGYDLDFVFAFLWWLQQHQAIQVGVFQVKWKAWIKSLAPSEFNVWICQLQQHHIQYLNWTMFNEIVRGGTLSADLPHFYLALPRVIYICCSTMRSGCRWLDKPDLSFFPFQNGMEFPLFIYLLCCLAIVNLLMYLHQAFQFRGVSLVNNLTAAEDICYHRIDTKNSEGWLSSASNSSYKIVLRMSAFIYTKGLANTSSCLWDKPKSYAWKSIRISISDNIFSHIPTFQHLQVRYIMC